MRDARGNRRSLSARTSFAAVAGVLVVALWASGSASMVYPLFAERWQVDEVVTTALFAVYPIALVLALVVCGSISDVLGRRRVLLAGVGLVSAGTALFVISEGMVLAFVGRSLQGIGVGVAMSAASAALVELAPVRKVALATAVNTAATAGGTALALLLGGALVEHSPFPARMPFIVLLGAAIGLLPLLWFMAEPTAPGKGRWRPSPVRLPSSGRLTFASGVVCLTVAFMMGAVFVGLGAQIVADLIDTPDALLAGLALASWALAIIPASIVARRGTPKVVAVIGGVLSVLGSGALLFAGRTESLGVFLVSAVLSGVAYGLMFYGGLGLVTETTDTGPRAAILSFMYLVAYFAQGLTAVGIGWLATVWGLDTAITIAMPSIAALSLLSALATSSRHDALVALAEPFGKRGRLLDGRTETMLDSIYEAWRTDRDEGLRTLMIAATGEVVVHLNDRARADRGRVLQEANPAGDGAGE